MRRKTIRPELTGYGELQEIFRRTSPVAKGGVAVEIAVQPGVERRALKVVCIIHIMCLQYELQT